MFTKKVHGTVHQLSKRNETVPGQNQIFFSLKLRDLGGLNFRWLEHILTVPLSSSQRSSTVLIVILSF